MAIPNEQFDFLIGLNKAFEKTEPIELGPPPISWSKKIITIGSHDTFILDFYRGRFEIKKYTVNARYRTIIILFRYDAQGTHTNPDGEKFDGPHIHFYKEGYDDKFAFPVSIIGIAESDSIEVVFRKLMNYFNVINTPPVAVSLF